MPFMAETAKLGRPRSIDPGLHKEALLPGDWGHILHPEDQGIRLPALGRDSRGNKWLVPCTHMGVRVCMLCVCVPPCQSLYPRNVLMNTSFRSCKVSTLADEPILRYLLGIQRPDVVVS